MTLSKHALVRGNYFPGRDIESVLFLLSPKIMNLKSHNICISIYAISNIILCLDENATRVT